MKEIVFQVLQNPDGAFSAKSLDSRISASGPSFDDLRKNVRSKVNELFDEANCPALIRLYFDDHPNMD